MGSRDPSKGLSKTLLQMKFMARRGSSAASSSEAPSAASARPGTRRRFARESGLEKLEGLAFGRMSFQGANPAVEKLMSFYDEKRRQTEDEDADVTAGDVASLNETIARKVGGSKKSKKRIREEDEKGELEESPSDSTPPKPSKKQFKKPKL